jgi:hypothetical protein
MPGKPGKKRNEARGNVSPLCDSEPDYGTMDTIGFPRLRIIIGEPIEVARAPEEPVAATKLTERLRAAVESLA